ncbi:MAG: hypothetical protein ACR2LK_03510 [Solirubrobacteraceae bacterium]
MTSIKHEWAPDASSRVVCGTYARDGVEHTLVAIREHDARWRLLDVDRDTTIVIESFYPDEELEAAQAVATLYLADRRTQAGNGLG